MGRFFRSLREGLLRAKLYFFGVRFYEWVDVSECRPVHEVEYFLDNKYHVRFIVYQIECVDFVLRQGTLVGDTYSSFIVRAYFSDEDTLPQALKLMNKKCYYFNGQMNEFGKDNEAILSLLSDVYLDMIYAQLKKEKK